MTTDRLAHPSGAVMCVRCAAPLTIEPARLRRPSAVAVVDPARRREWLACASCGAWTRLGDAQVRRHADLLADCAAGDESRIVERTIARGATVVRVGAAVDEATRLRFRFGTRTILAAEAGGQGSGLLLGWLLVFGLLAAAWWLLRADSIPDHWIMDASAVVTLLIASDALVTRLRRTRRTGADGRPFVPRTLLDLAVSDTGLRLGYAEPDGRADGASGWWRSLAGAPTGPTRTLDAHAAEAEALLPALVDVRVADAMLSRGLALVGDAARKTGALADAGRASLATVLAEPTRLRAVVAGLHAEPTADGPLAVSPETVGDAAHAAVVALITAAADGWIDAAPFRDGAEIATAVYEV